MSDDNNNGRNSAPPGGRQPLTLKPRGAGSVSAGTVKQSFSHGRTKNVVVETKSRKRVVPGPAAPVTGANGAPAPTIKLGKITLDKQGQSAKISLRKDGQKDPISVNLNWDKGGGFLRASADLDLGCMFVM